MLLVYQVLEKPLPVHKKPVLTRSLTDPHQHEY